MNYRNQKVIDNLMARKKKSEDGKKIGLIIQGGGMRDVFSGGVLTVLEEMGLNDKFDYIYGASSGAACGAFFLANQGAHALPIFWEDLSYFKFIQPWSFHNKMNLENIVRAMVVKRKLNIEKVKKSSTLFKIFVTDYETGLSKYFCNHDDVDLIQAIKATCAYPGFHTPIEVQGRRYLDGYVRKMIPINDAIKDGCTDVLIITATPQDYIRADGWLFRFVLATALIPLNRKFKKAYNRMFKEEQLELKEAFGEAKLIKKINIFTISPDYLINNAEIRPSVLERYGRHGIKVAREVFCRLRIRV